MYFVKFFTTGYDGRDPRDRTIAVYKCGACGHSEWYTIPQPSNFLKEPRCCPACKSMGVEDLRKSLETKRAALEAQQEKVRAEIEKVISELNRLETVEQPKG